MGLSPEGEDLRPADQPASSLADSVGTHLTLPILPGGPWPRSGQALASTASILSVRLC
jgi:hypothetical protein